MDYFMDSCYVGTILKQEYLYFSKPQNLKWKIPRKRNINSLMFNVYYLIRRLT